MKVLPKHCLPHHAVLLLVYLSALFLTSRAANLPNLFYMAFNGLVLGLSAAYLRRHTECRRLHPGADDRCIG